MQELELPIKQRNKRSIIDYTSEYKGNSWAVTASIFSKKTVETLKISVVEGLEIKLPIEFQGCELILEIQKSTKILKYKKNWDGEGSKAYSKETFVNAVSFLVRYAKWIWDEKLYAIPSPKILPGSNGAIDLYWKRANYDLIISIPEYPSEKASYYGDDKKDNVCEGTFNVKNDTPGIFLTLLELS